MRRGWIEDAYMLEPEDEDEFDDYDIDAAIDMMRERERFGD